MGNESKYLTSEKSNTAKASFKEAFKFRLKLGFIFIGAPYVEKLRGNEKLNAVLQGVTAAVVGVILNLALAFGSTVIFAGNGVNWFGITLSAAAFIILLRFKIYVMRIVLAGGILGLLKAPVSG